ncbi:MAG TPA: endopeptidase La [Thermomicrobiales bacterium]|nr:endopeptidase La [Thermomicrobiales bacterium]
MVTEVQPTTPADVQIPDALPILPLGGSIVVFPFAVVPLVVAQPTSVRLVDDAMSTNRLIALIAQRDEAHEPLGRDDLHSVGVVSIVHQLLRAPDGTLRLVVQGLERIRLEEIIQTEPYLIGRVEQAPDTYVPDVEVEGLRRALLDLFRRVVELTPNVSGDIVAVVEQLADPRQIAYYVASTVPLSGAVRQEILEINPVDAKLRRLIEALQHEVTVRELGERITSETQQRMNKAQREYFLREQLRSIQQELGEGEEGSELADLHRRVDEAGLPAEARREADRELGRLASIPQASPEYGIIRTYLDWMLSLPWNTLTGGTIEIERARHVLNEDHYDLEKIKDRILEYLAVRKLRQERQGRLHLASSDTSDEPQLPSVQTETLADGTAHEPILCFVGPPGVGKTSLGQSIARAMGRKFVRMSLGGVRDEAEIRGHRRTYIGALPGRIIQGIRQAETRDPVFMLDEIDKVGTDWRGDPSSALLEVLDPAQNHSFVDNYLGVPFDLSQVLFIATANTLDSIPGPLQDRMEVLPLSGYTDEEKLQIARQYLVPKQVAAHGLEPGEIMLEDDAIRRIIRGYTREAGVRNLGREIASICRKVAREIAEGRSESVTVDVSDVERYLGRARFQDDVAERTDRPGVATGLAWTPAGGDVLFVEAAMIPSREERLILTGMLGEVMRESAQAAVTWVRSNAERLGIDPALFEGMSIHLHVPAGAIPKDGPSAGVTMMTALVSLASGRPVHSDVAMTGEITLRGKVLPVGGIKEKVLAANRAGIETVILPRQNERDLDDVPDELRRELEFVLVESAEEVIERALPLEALSGRGAPRVMGEAYGREDPLAASARSDNRENPHQRGGWSA